MNFLQHIFGKAHTDSASSIKNFWQWFTKHEATFRKARASEQHTESRLLNPVLRKLKKVHSEITLLCGWHDAHTAELIFTADGVLKNIPFAEALAAAAPHIPGWKFTALKPAAGTEDFSLQMNTYTFDETNLRFCYFPDASLPLATEIIILYQHYNEADKEEIQSGVYIFLDNLLGELNIATATDNIRVLADTGYENGAQPLNLLKPLLEAQNTALMAFRNEVWENRGKEQYLTLQGIFDNGLPYTSILNHSAAKYSSKPAYPWILCIQMPYQGAANKGMPQQETLRNMQHIEDAIIAELQPTTDYIHLGSETGANLRVVYFAAKDFRKASHILYKTLHAQRSRAELNYQIYRDPYWQIIRNL